MRKKHERHQKKSKQRREMDHEEGDPLQPQQAEEEEEGGDEEREGLSDLQQFNILLSVLVDLSAIGDYDVCNKARKA